MIVANFVSNIPTMDDTRTYEDFFKYLGDKPTRLGVVSRMYPLNTAAFLTESLGNIFHLDLKSSGNKYQKTNSLMYEWEIETNQIERIEFAAVPEGDGANGTEIIMAFRKRYYAKYDTFKIEGSDQQCFCLTNPVRKGDNYWEQTVRLVDSTYSSALNLDYCQPGMKTRWISNHHPELHDEGHVKWTSNAELHRGYVTTHRCDATYSALYAAYENKFIEIGEGKNEGNLSRTIYKMDTLEKNLLDNFMTARGQALLFSKSNINPKTGKPNITDPVTNRPIYISDGVIPQCEAYCNKYAYNKLTVNVLQEVMGMLNEKADDPQGNHYVFICNEKFFQDLNRMLGHYLAQFHTDGTYMWSKKANDYISIGPKGFDSYNFIGNSVSFKVDRTFSLEYGYDKGFALALDLTADKTSTQPPIAMFSLKGADIVTNKYEGVGKANGISSGDVASPVAGTKRIVWGYSGIAVFNPYRSAILREV